MFKKQQKTGSLRQPDVGISQVVGRHNSFAGTTELILPPERLHAPGPGTGFTQVK
jgi:hypothetical protein